MKIKVIFLNFLGLFAGYILLYLLVHFVLSRIPTSAVNVAGVKNIEIYIMQSGVHTDFIVPVKNTVRNWKEIFPTENTRDKDTNVHFLSIGWGDRDFYLSTPTWFDLTPKIALSAAFGLGSSAIHSFYYYDLPPGRLIKKIKLTENQYKKLVNYVDNNLKYSSENQLELLTASKPEIMYNNDAYYSAKGKYNMSFTCNTWINEGLKVCEQKAALWTAFGGGIFYHYRK